MDQQEPEDQMERTCQRELRDIERLFDLDELERRAILASLRLVYMLGRTDGLIEHYQRTAPRIPPLDEGPEGPLPDKPF